MRISLALLGIVVVVGGILASSALFIVSQTEQALVLQFGEPKRVLKEPGLKVKIPFIQNVVTYDSRVLSLDPPPVEMILNDQKRIILDAFARYRIDDPLKYFQTVRTETTFNDRFGRLMNSAVRGIVAKNSIEDVLSSERIQIMAAIGETVTKDGLNFGVTITDLRIGRSELPEDVSNNVYDRMRSEREREANLLRAEGEENSRRIRAEADRAQTVIIAEAQRQSSILHGDGDATKNRLLADAFNRDREFFDFYRSLEAYRATFGADDTTMVLSPNSDFFRYFGSIGGNPGGNRTPQ